jgi:hypothetical protein
MVQGRLLGMLTLFKSFSRTCQFQGFGDAASFGMVLLKAVTGSPRYRSVADISIATD